MIKFSSRLEICEEMQATATQRSFVLVIKVFLSNCLAYIEERKYVNDTL